MARDHDAWIAASAAPLATARWARRVNESVATDFSADGETDETTRSVPLWDTPRSRVSRWSNDSCQAVSSNRSSDRSRSKCARMKAEGESESALASIARALSLKAGVPGRSVCSSIPFDPAAVAEPLQGVAVTLLPSGTPNRMGPTLIEVFPQGLPSQRKRCVHPDLARQTLQADQYPAGIFRVPRPKVELVGIARQTARVRRGSNHRAQTRQHETAVLRLLVLPPGANVLEREIGKVHAPRPVRTWELDTRG